MMNRHEKAALDELLRWSGEARRLDEVICSQRERIRELEALVDAAYREGFADGYDDDARAQHAGDAWRHSESKKALESENKELRQEEVKRLKKRIKALKSKYNELLMAVSRVDPEETRHQTALRYIQQREEWAIPTDQWPKR